MKPISFLGLLCFALISPAILFAADDAELKRIGGRFEHRFKNAAGVEFRVVKEVAGEKSSVTTYDDAGNVVEAHSSTIKVEKRGPVRVLTFFDVVVTAGPNKGFKDAAEKSYIYRMAGDTFTEVWGMLEDDPSPPGVYVWERTKEAK